MVRIRSARHLFSPLLSSPSSFPTCSGHGNLFLHHAVLFDPTVLHGAATRRGCGHLSSPSVTPKWRCSTNGSASCPRELLRGPWDYIGSSPVVALTILNRGCALTGRIGAWATLVRLPPSLNSSNHMMA